LFFRLTRARCVISAVRFYCEIWEPGSAAYAWKGQLRGHIVLPDYSKHPSFHILREVRETYPESNPAPKLSEMISFLPFVIWPWTSWASDKHNSSEWAKTSISLPLFLTSLVHCKKSWNIHLYLPFQTLLLRAKFSGPKLFRRSFLRFSHIRVHVKHSWYFLTAIATERTLRGELEPENISAATKRCNIPAARNVQLRHTGAAKEESVSQPQGTNRLQRFEHSGYTREGVRCSGSNRCPSR
jgi:hypothetical protein